MSMDESKSALLDSRHSLEVFLDVAHGKAGRVSIQADEPSLVARLLSEDGREIRRLQSGYPGQMYLSFFSLETNTYRLVLEAPKALNGSVQVTIGLESGAASGVALASQMEAERIYTEAQALRTQPSAAALQTALEFYEKARLHWLAGRSGTGQALALISKAETWLQLCNYPEALRAYSLARPLISRGTAQEVLFLNGEARVYLDWWRRENALALSEEALKLSRNIRDAGGEAYAMANRAEAKYLLTDQEGTKSDLSQAMALAQADHNRGVMARVYRIQSWLDRDTGHVSEGTEKMHKSDELFQQIGDVRNSLWEMFDIANDDYLRGDTYSAIMRQLKLSKLFHDAGDIDDEANAANGIGLDYVDLNRPREALTYFLEADRLFASIKNVWTEQSSIGLICNTELTLNMLHSAESYCKESKRLSLLFHVPYFEGEADWHLGKLAQSQNRYAEALAYYREAADLAGKAHYLVGEVSAVASMGLLKDETGDHHAAIAFFQQALSLSLSAEDPVGTLNARYRLAHSQYMVGEFVLAKSELDQALEVFESQRLKIRDHKLRTSYFLAAGKCYDLYTEILMTQHERKPKDGFDLQALEKSEAGRARTLLDSLTRNDSQQQINRAKANPEIARLHAALNEAYEMRVNLIVRGGNDPQIQRNAADIRRLDAKYNEALDIEKDNSKMSLSPSQKPLSASQMLRRSEASGTVIFEYSLGEKRSFLWSIDHGKLTTAILPGRQVITTAAQGWLDLVAARQRRPNETFTHYRLRVQAADRELPQQSAKLSCMILPESLPAEGSRVQIIASGVLQSIPFAALPLNGCHSVDGPPLVTVYEIGNAPSVSVFNAGLNAGPEAAPFGGDVAILADPVFSMTDPRVLNHNGSAAHAASLPALQSALRDVGYGTELPRLSATRKEADAINSALPSAKILLATDFKANLQTALSEELSQYRIWHFATHGLLDVKDPDLSGLIFSLIDSQGRPTPGYLKTQDIFDLSIRTDLVVLSACNSGLGEQVDGEGTVGLAYAFLHAGARQVVSTLWSIDDDASSELMAEFYKALFTERLTPAAALSRAQRALLLKKRNAAFYWAGYVITSN